MSSPDFQPSDPEALALYLAEQELALEREHLTLVKENQIEFYCPHAKQADFHAAASFHYRYARTGNRFGKSEMGAAEDVAFALGYRPWLPVGDPGRTLGIPSHATKGLIVCTTWKKSREVFTECESGGLGKLFKYIPKSALGTPTKNHSGFIDRIPVKHVSGEWSVIFLDTIEGFKKNPLAQESSVHDWVHIDEPIPEGMFKAIARGLVDRKGHAWFTCTPLTEPWIDEVFVPELGDVADSTINLPDLDKSRWWMKGSMYDNPHNDEAAIKLFLSFLTEDEQECRLYGIPTSMAGLVYKEFDPLQHIRHDIDGKPNPPPGWASWDRPTSDACIYDAIDYHFRKADAVLFAAVMPDDRIYIYAEIWKQMLLEDEVKEIKDILGDNFSQPCIIDPLASTPNKVNDITAMDEYRRHGLICIPATKDPVNGIRAVKALLKCRGKDGSVLIQVNPACKRFLFEIQRGFVWDGDENKPVKKNDDMMENLYRMALQGFVYIEPPTAADYRPLVLPDFDDIDISLDDPIPESEQARQRRLRNATRYRPSSAPDLKTSTSFLHQRYGTN